MAPTEPAIMNKRDVEIVIAAFQSLKSAPQIDFELLAQKANFKNAKVANTQWGTLKKKFGLVPGASTPAKSPEKKAPGTPKSTAGTPRKRKADHDPHNGMVTPSPVKKQVRDDGPADVQGYPQVDQAVLLLGDEDRHLQQKAMAQHQHQHQQSHEEEDPIMHSFAHNGLADGEV
ncbi:hypothetical protein F4780DRAFT_508888 [Xylariomycetidae sp. FL0641]|nr:hypothetical protein F4780DRAFT_508888 [Xylariomycetidae sp. FL0641]